MGLLVHGEPLLAQVEAHLGVQGQAALASDAQVARATGHAQRAGPQELPGLARRERGLGPGRRRLGWGGRVDCAQPGLESDGIAIMRYC